MKLIKHTFCLALLTLSTSTMAKPPPNPAAILPNVLALDKDLSTIAIRTDDNRAPTRVAIGTTAIPAKCIEIDLKKMEQSLKEEKMSDPIVRLLAFYKQKISPTVHGILLCQTEKSLSDKESVKRRDRSALIVSGDGKRIALPGRTLTQVRNNTVAVLFERLVKPQAPRKPDQEKTTTPKPDKPQKNKDDLLLQ